MVSIARNNLKINKPTPDQGDIKDLLGRVDCRRLAASLGLHLKKQHRNYDVYYSPLRDDGSTASFTVYANGYKDYGGSQESGNALDLLIAVENLSFSEAARRLEQYVGGATHFTPQERPQPTSHSEPPDAAWQHNALAALDRYERNIRPALDYLHGRGLSDETIKAHRLGFNPDWHNGTPPGIVIPSFYNGALWLLRIREYGKALSAKYLNKAGSKLTGALFNGDAIRPGEPLLIVEGEFDAMLAGQELAIPVITPGPVSNTLGRLQLEHIRQASTVYILPDNDGPGQGAAATLAAAIGDKAVILPALPVGKDVTEYVCEHGGDLAAWFDQQADTLLDAGAIWDALPDRKLSQNSDEVNAGRVPDESDLIHSETLVSDNADGLLKGVILAAQMLGRKNTAAILKAVDDAGLADTWWTAGELAATDTAQRLGLTEHIIWRYFRSPDDDLLSIFSITDDDLVTNFSCISTEPIREKIVRKYDRGRPATQYRVNPQEQLADYFKAKAARFAFELAVYDGNPQPVQWTPDLLAALPEDQQPILDDIHAAHLQAAATDSDYADDYRLFLGRNGEIIRYLERELTRSDYASEYPLEADLGDGTPHNLMAAHTQLYYFSLEPDRTGDVWLFKLLCGVSAPTLRKVRAEIAHLRYADDTRLTVEIAPDQPDQLAAEVKRLARSKSGRALFISTTGTNRIPYRRENLTSIAALAARQGTKIEITLNVSQPLERFTPAEKPAEILPETRETPLAKTASEDTTERAPRRPKREPAAVLLASLRRIPLALGWQYDAENGTWMHPDGGDLYADHMPTIFKVINGEDIPMLTMHHQAEKYDDSHPVTNSLQDKDPAQPAKPQNTATLEKSAPAPLYLQNIDLRTSVFGAR